MAAILKRKYKVKLADGRTIEKECRTWVIQYRDAAGKIKRAKGYRDYGATKQLAAKIEKRIARGEQALVDEYAGEKARKMAEHIAEYVADLRAKGRDAKYIYNAEHRLTILADACPWKTLGDVEPNSFVTWRQAQAAGRFNGPGRDGTKVSAETLNQYLETAVAFCNWCAANKRLPGVPRGNGRVMATVLAGVGKVEGQAKRKRRALTDAQVMALLAIAPEDRRIIYRVALALGIRRAELDALEWGDVRLNAIRPYVQLRAEATKANRADRLPMPASLAADLRARRPADARDKAKVFPTGVPSIEDWRADLATAKIPWMDEQGRQADFHGGTRKTLCTRLHRAGVPLVTAMRIMRHTDSKLTLVDYTDDSQLGVEDAITSLPELTTPAAAAPAAVAAIG